MISDYITDPEEVKKLEEGSYGSSPTTQQPLHQSQDQGWGIGEENPLAIGGKKLWTSLVNVAAANTPNPEDSRYAARSALHQNQVLEERSKKLGIGGQLVSGAVEYAPAIAAGIVNPVAGGVASGLTTGGDILGEQYKQKSEYDTRGAFLGGAASGTIDAFTGGVASKFLPESSGLIKRAATNFAEDAVSGMGQQAAFNVATDKDATEGLGTAAVMSGGMGAALRGGVSGVQSLRGLNKSLNIPFNKGGDSALNKVETVRSEGGIEPIPDFESNVVEFQNASHDYNTRAQEGQVSELDAEDMANFSVERGGDSALLDAATYLKDKGVPLTHASFNFNYGDDFRAAEGNKFAGSNFGLTPKQVQLTADIAENARPSIFKHKGSRTIGETAESHRKAVQETGLNELKNTVGNANANLVHIEKTISKMKRFEDPSPAELGKYLDLRSSLREIARLHNNYAGENPKDLSSELAWESAKAMKLANELGQTRNMKGYDGKPETWNPAQDVRIVNMMENMLRAEYPSLHQGTPDVTKEKTKSFAVGNTPAGLVTDALLVGSTGVLPGAAMVGIRRGAKGISEGVSALKSQKSLRKEISKAGITAQDLSSYRTKIREKVSQDVESKLADSDLEGASKSSEAVLETEGIEIPKGMESGLNTPVTPEENVSLWSTDGIDMGLTRKPIQRAVTQPTVEPTPTIDTTLEARRMASRPPKQPEEIVAEESIPTTPEPTQEVVVETVDTKSTQELAKRRNGLADLKERVSVLESKPRTPQIASELFKSKTLVDLYTQAVDKLRVQKVGTPEDVHQAIKDLGGITELTRYYGIDKQPEIFQEIKAKVKENIENKKLENKAKISEVVETLDKDIEKGKKDNLIKKSKESTQIFKDESKASEIDDKLIEESIDAGTDSDGIFHKSVAKARLKTLLTKQKAELEKEISTKETPPESTKEVKPELTIKDSRKALEDFAEELGMYEDKQVIKLIDNATRNVASVKNAALGVSQMRSLMAKIHNILVDKLDKETAMYKADSIAYEAALKSPKTVDVVEEARIKGIMSKHQKGMEELKAKVEASKKAQSKEAARVAKEVSDRVKNDEKISKIKNQYDEKVSKLKERITSLQSSITELSKKDSKASKVEEVDSLKEDIKVAEDVAKKHLEGVSEGELDDISLSLEKKFLGSSSSVTDLTKAIGAAKVIASKIDNPVYKKTMLKFSEVLTTSAENKIKYPDQKKLWLSRDDFEELKDMRFGDVTSSYSGSLGPLLTNAIYGEHFKLTDLLSRAKIKSITEDLDKGKGMSAIEVEMSQNRAKEALKKVSKKGSEVRKLSRKLYVG